MNKDEQVIVIKGYGAISPLGADAATTSQAYTKGIPAFTTIQHQGQPTPVAALPPEADQKIQALVQTNRNYKALDRSVLMAVYAAQEAAAQAGWVASDNVSDEELAVNIGSSRGATGLFEQHYEAFQKSELSSSASPTTTLGNISSWVAQAVNAGGAQISHSITCSTALMALANGLAWLKAGMAKRFLAGGAEAPLTAFTIAQMKAIGIYSRLSAADYPCRPYAQNGNSTFVLGEGAAVFALESIPAHLLKKGDVIVEAIGFGFEKLNSKTGISKEGINFQMSMQKALQQLPATDKNTDLLISHTPGTQAGDLAELTAIEHTFKKNIPVITSNKWMIGHSLGASGALSLEYALYLFAQQKVLFPSYLETKVPSLNTNFVRIMVNAAGFGGNAASVILRKI
ncbi:beta-ketoacyl synthase N-terminal-like domain-containing protein [Pontibacter sp. SGAir0037]|uniref:beta-ketoacyl synthase N-terminal-like domain-containing protein n=1 Tax=Pontibacter sp. SGAir0037 TaxID=2571030 RepID=UPI0010CCF286|nr:beta-ketoacyl synthase N-terminal-like domain-containing protein [Pontibacter sp. SGAir0037]QCR21418.1 beta-ketoacyl-ACP reductase [Pontibacter sp. SGAir0037]